MKAFDVYSGQGIYYIYPSLYLSDDAHFKAPYFGPECKESVRYLSYGTISIIALKVSLIGVFFLVILTLMLYFKGII